MPAHQRPTMREMGRRSEAADHPFKAMRPDDGTSASPRTWPIIPALPARPTILIERLGQRDVVTAACPLAWELGLRVGMAAAHARALVPDLDVRDAQPDGDRAFLDRLALHAVGHWTPSACVSDADGLWLDLSGTTHLFGGEEPFCRKLVRFLARLGFSARVAVAGTPGAAHALARYGGRTISVVAPHAETRSIAELPVAALRLEAAALAAAARFGFERVADLYPVARGPLAKRLGIDTVRRLDQARGLIHEPITPLVPFEEPSAERQLLEPIVTADAIGEVIGDLVDDLCEQLQTRNLGARTLVLACWRVDAEKQCLWLGMARGTRDAAHIKRMLRMRIERIEPGLGIETASLAASRVEPLAPVMLAAAFAGDQKPSDIAPLVDQLVGRVGEAGLFRMTSVESDVPERAARRASPLAPCSGWPAWTRPARLLRRPECLSRVIALLPDHPPRRFTWRGKAYDVVAGDGPERVHGEWWRSTREMWAVRDYFRVETEGGARFWIFRRGDGVLDETGDLTWHMHGLFG